MSWWDDIVGAAAVANPVGLAAAGPGVFGPGLVSGGHVPGLPGLGVDDALGFLNDPLGSLKNFWGDLSGSKGLEDAMRESGKLAYDATTRGQDLQREAWQQSRADQMPFRDFGLGALHDYYGRLQAGGNDADLQRFQAEQTANFNTQMAKRGLLGSSASTKGLSDLGAKIAEAREQRYYDRMQPLLGIGSGVSQNMSNQGLAYGRYQSDLGMQGANALGAGMTGAAQAHANSQTGLLNTGLAAAGLAIGA